MVLFPCLWLASDWIAAKRVPAMGGVMATHLYFSNSFAARTPVYALAKSYHSETNQIGPVVLSVNVGGHGKRLQLTKEY
jgi:hypothetical protein